MPELKAGLPRNFFGKKEDANLWLLAMKAYFALNLAQYKDKPKNKILAFLNKMDQGQGKSFVEGWLMKCSNPNISDTERTFEKIEEDFKEKFIPTDQASRSWHILADMRQEDDCFKGDFHKFKAEFELEATCSGITNEFILKDMLGNLASKMMALLEEPKTHKDWLWKARQFYNASLRMKKLQGGNIIFPLPCPGSPTRTLTPWMSSSST